MQECVCIYLHDNTAAVLFAMFEITYLNLQKWVSILYSVYYVRCLKKSITALLSLSSVSGLSSESLKTMSYGLGNNLKALKMYIAHSWWEEPEVMAFLQMAAIVPEKKLQLLFLR